jgi:GGDEF domain-containing protein
MARPEQLPKVGLWLACGGLAVLAAHHWLTVYEPELSIGNLVLLAGGLAGYLATALGVFLGTGYRNHGRSALAIAERGGGVSWQPTGGAASQAADGNPEEGHVASERGEVPRRVTDSFLAWCEQGLPDAHPWSSFDQLVREMLAEQLGAVRVRCYQVLPGEQQYRSLSQLGTSGDGKCARAGVLGHVATTGREFVAGDAAHGELVDQLAEEGNEPWEWVFPIREQAQTVGLVAVGKLPAPNALDSVRRRDLATLIMIFWRHVACLERLRIAQRTDKASGLLTRGDFFALATRALADSYAENEPVVVVVLALEGLRFLDDAGRWSEHDALVENIGLLIKRRIRTDDIIGRFSDDRFVLLLRRLDSGLGRLIAAKIQDTVQAQIEQLGDVGAALRMRVGLTGSGFHQPPLEGLLGAAWGAVAQARQQDVLLYADLGTAESPGRPPPTESSVPETQPERATP